MSVLIVGYGVNRFIKSYNSQDIEHDNDADSDFYFTDGPTMMTGKIEELFTYPLF